jgi:hemoglobin
MSSLQCPLGFSAGVNMSVDTQAGVPNNRNLAIEDIVARTGINEAMIKALVRAFYGRARHNPLIGPIFERQVHDWEAHIRRLGTFWSSVALMSGRYHGQPMLAHPPLPIDTPRFNRWLEIFAETARDLCPPAAAAHFLDRASRIADSLELGIAARKGEIRSRPPRSAWALAPARHAKGAR